MTFRAVLLIVSCWVFVAGAATPLDTLRTNARGLRAQVTALRADQLSKRSELSLVSARIETLKAGAKGALLSGGELDAALKRSQELSGVLTTLAQQSSVREAELETANLSLLEALSTELSSLRAQFDRQSERAARLRLIEQLKQLRAERESVRAALPASKVPNLEPLKPSDDPEELLEQAELIRDNAEKVARELKAVETRLRERREELELDRHVQRFLGEESMFDDQDRRLRVQHTTTLDAQTTAGGAKSGTPVSPPAATAAANDTTQAGTPAPGGFGGAFGGSKEFAPADVQARGAVDGQGLRVTNASDARPQLGGARSVASGDDDDIDGLEVEHLRLKNLAQQLQLKAKELEQRAAVLK